MILRSASGLFLATRLDAGTLSLMEHCSLKPGDVVVDLGCGYGAIGLMQLSA
ncbi:MAG: methyltransferase [Bacillota bacterium]